MKTAVKPAPKPAPSTIGGRGKQREKPKQQAAVPVK